MNSNKQSITLDLDRPEGQALFRRLAGWADAVVDTSQPGQMAERGIGYEQLHESCPELVWVSLTPFGLTGPRRGWKGSDLVAWATSGLLNLNGYPGAAPQVPGGSLMLGYGLAALNAAAGCLLALQAREMTGKGQLVDISTQEAVLMGLGETSVGGFLDDLLPRKRSGNRRIYVVPYGIFPCKDGYVNIVIAQPAHWLQLAEWIKEKTGDDTIAGPVFQDFQTRMQMKEEVEGRIEALTLQFGKQELFEEAEKRGIPITPVNTVADLSKDPQLAARRYWVEVDDRDLGQVRMAGAPCCLSEAPWRAGRAPGLGEHNEVVYGEQLGISPSELAFLKLQGVT